MEHPQEKIFRASHVVLFGLGAQFKNCYEQLVLALGREPHFLCDNDPQKWGGTFFGKKCLSPSELKQLAVSYPRVAVIITIRRYEPLVEQLCAMGIDDIFLACYDRSYDIVFALKKPVCDFRSETSEPSIPSLVDRWTLITGANRGIGREIAQAMARLGSNLILHARMLEHTDSIARTCRDYGIRVERLTADFSNTAELEKMLRALQENFPPVDILFNNAAICYTYNDGWRVPGQDYFLHYAVNTVSPILIASCVLQQMLERRFGRIVNISSTIERQPQQMPYACSKAALNKFVNDMAPNLDGTGVSMCLLCPGHVRTDMGGLEAPQDVSTVIPGALLGAIMGPSLNGRWIRAQDYAGLSLMEAVRKARYYYGIEDDT
ncbi:SDR family NAD(P)-dependent oxidoreductase [Desulfosoma sp.]